MAESYIYSNDFKYIILMILFFTIVFILLFYDMIGQAKYGKWYSPERFSFSINGRLAWIIKEIPMVIIIGYCDFLYIMRHISKNNMYIFEYFNESFSIINFIFLTILFIHYFNRTFIFSFKINDPKPTQIYVVLMGCLFCTGNGLLQGRWLIIWKYYDINDAYSLNFIIGLPLCLIGMLINIHSDNILIQLRKYKSGKRYLIPYGGMFNFVSVANYTGEIFEWFGYALATWSLPGFCFFYTTACNLIPRAVKTHKWYLDYFGTCYKKLKRKAVIPYLL